MALSLNGMQMLALRMSEVWKVRRARESGSGGLGALLDEKHFTRPRVKVFLLKEFSEHVSVRLTVWGREEQGS